MWPFVTGQSVLFYLKDTNFNGGKKQLRLLSELFRNSTGDENCLVVSSVQIMHHDQ